MTASPAPSPPPAPFHCVRQTPYGWLALLGTEHSLQRVSLQPELPAALAGLGLPSAADASLRRRRDSAERRPRPLGRHHRRL